MARKLMIASLIASPLACPAIAQGEEARAICTLEARTSVTVTVVDALGGPVSDAVVTFSVDGRPAQACVRFPFLAEGGYICGWETAGHFTITARRGADTGTAALDVTRDECHVRSQRSTLRLAR